RGRGHRGRRARARANGRYQRRPVAKGFAALQRRPGRRLGDRARSGRRWAPSSGRVLDRAGVGGAGGVPAHGGGRAAPRPDVSGPLGAGVLLYDKPAGVTSHDVVAAIRRRLGRGTKVGHAGTLDPFATGLLLILLGRATRTQRFLMELPKTYLVVARFGAVSSTGDPEGEITETGNCPDEPLELPTGPLRQR